METVTQQQECTVNAVSIVLAVVLLVALLLAVLLGTPEQQEAIREAIAAVLCF
jgi:hypothetical protein